MEEERANTKRSAEEQPAEAQPAAKRRSRWGEDGAGGAAQPAPTAPAPPAPPAMDPAAIAAAKASARAALERARLAVPHAALVAAPRRAEVMHASLILDASGRLVDSSSGKVVTDSRGPMATAKANQAARTQRANPYLAHAPEQQAAAAAAAAGVRPSARDQRGRRALHFYQKGEVVERAQEMRAQVATEAAFTRAADSASAAVASAREPATTATGGATRGAVSRSEAAVLQIPPAYLEAALAAGNAQLPPLPRVEWWDALILKRAPPADGGGGGGASADAAGGGAKAAQPRYELGVEPDRVTLYVEHPPPVEPPAELAPPPPQPLPLTAKERKKLRTQRRQAAERARQDQVRAGLVAPPPPKVKLSNLMRALGEHAVSNPTEMEARVRAQIAEREAAHLARNAASKKTKEERREAKLAKVAKDIALGVHVVVYRVSTLPTRQQLHKVELNATQLHFTGTCLLVAAPTPPAPGALAGASSAPYSLAGARALGGAGAAGCSPGGGALGAIVVAEGGAKAQRAYAKLMLRRIRWDDDYDEQAGAQAPGAGLMLAPRVRPECRLVWRGLVAKGYFKQFKVEQPRSADAARKFFADRGVPHYWDAAVAYSPDGRGLVDALEAEGDLLAERSKPSAQPPRAGAGTGAQGDAWAGAERGADGGGPMDDDDDDDE